MWFLALKFSNYPSQPVPLPELFVTTRTDPVPKSNIARGTTDPEIDSVTWIQICTSFQCSNDRVCLTITWHYLNWLQIWPQDGATCHLQADLCFILMYRVYLKGRYNVLNFTWHHLNWLHFWSPRGATSNSCKLALITSLHHLHCLIALKCPIGTISQY